MNIFRRIFASLLIAVFMPVVLATVLLWGLLNTIATGPIEKAMGASRAGERLPALVTAQLAPMLEKIPLQPKGFTVSQLVAEALPPAQVDELLAGFIDGNLAYIRGEKSESVLIETQSLFPGIKTALIAHLPKAIGKTLAGNVQAAFAAQGLDKGLAIPADALKQARDAYAAMRMSADIAIAAVLIALGIILLIAPHGLRGRLKYAGAAALIAGIVTAAIGAAVGAIAEFALSRLRNVPSTEGAADGAQSVIRSLPPEVMDAIKDFGSSLASSLGRTVLIYGGIFAALGIACLVAMAFFKRGSGAQKASPRELRTLPSAMYDQPPKS